MNRNEHNKVMIHVHDLWKSFGKLQVLKELNLDVYEGETVVILGRSGVGKSVLLRQIIGIDHPDKGYIDINNIRMNDPSPQKRLQGSLKMGMLFQGSALFDSLNIGENTAFYLRQHKLDMTEKEIQDSVMHALKMVGLENTHLKMPSELSGGMRKRAALARLIVYQPSVILYDEPTTGLDPITAMQINELINKTRQELNATSLVVTHDIRSAMEVADRIAFHHEGKLIYIAPKKEFFKTDNPLILSFLENAVLKKE